MKLEGSFPVLMTPFTDEDKIDEVSQRRLVDFLIDAGSDGITMLANGSEGYALSDKERSQLIKVVVDQVSGRVPLVVTVSHFSTRIAIERSLEAEIPGVNAIMSLPPHFGVRPASLDGVYEYYEMLSEAVSIPVIVQDGPGSSGIQMPVEFLAKLANNIENVKALKIETKNTPPKIGEVKKMLKDDDVSIFGGHGGIVFIEELERGSNGCMPASDIPEVTAGIYDAYKAGEKEKAESIYNQCLPYMNFYLHCGIRYAPKEVLKMGGIIRSSRVRSPGLGAEVKWDEEAKRRLRYLVKKADLLALRYLDEKRKG